MMKKQIKTHFIMMTNFVTLQAGEKQQLPELTKKGSISLSDVVAMLIRVFVDASPHIPEHRQLPLFTHLISTVGSVQFLHTAVLLLLEKHVVQGANNPDHDKQVSFFPTLLVPLLCGVTVKQ